MTSQAIDVPSRIGMHAQSVVRCPTDSGELIPFSKREPSLPGTSFFSRGVDEGTEDHRRAIHEELRKLLRSPLLVQSDRLSRFLRFAVDSTLDGNTNLLKEYTIGVEAYGRRPDFDPSQDSIVRTEARRLRTKLKKYYQEEGEKDPILIDFRPGSYVPTFRVNRAAKPQSIRYQEDVPPSETQQLSISVLPFAHVPGDTFGEACAPGLTDEVMHCLTQVKGIRVFACTSGCPGDYAEAQLGRKHGGWMFSKGIVRTEGHRIRVTSRLFNEEGLHIASWRFDAEASPEELFGALESIASEIVSCIDTHQMVRRGA